MRRYYERTARLLADLDELEASMGNAQTNPQGRLRVDVGSALASLLIIPALSTFFDRYPDIQLDLGVSDRPVDLIGDNVDCVIRGGELTDQSLVARRIGNLPLATVASPEYLHRFGTPPNPQALEKNHHMANFFSPRTGRMFANEFLKDGSMFANEVLKDGTQSTPNSSYRIAVNDSNAYMAATLAGLGIAQLTTFMAAPHLADGTLVQLLPEWDIPSIPIYVVYPPNWHLSAKVRSFVDWAADLLTKHAHLQ